MTNKAWLKSRNHLIGPFTRIGKPEIIEILALSGFDFAIVDFEHGATVQIQDVYPLILAAENKNIRLIARIPGVNETYIKWLLDLGIHGLQIPHIKNAEDAALAIRYSKFSPSGERGICRFVRAAEFSHIPKDVYLKQANEQSLIILQIEGKEGLENIEEIIKVDGIDIIFVGPYDLSQSMGFPGEIWHPSVIGEIENLIRICKNKNIELGIFTDTPEGVRRWKNLGVKYINYRIDTELFLDFAKKSLLELST